MCEEMESIDEMPSIQISEEMESSGKMASTQIRVAEASTQISEAMERKRKEMEIKRKEMEIIKNDLLIMAMKGDWDKVVDKYRSNPVAHKVKIRSGDTALHMAISDGKEEIVKMLIDQIKSPQEGGIEALKIKNKLGNTPLHLAVSMGTVAMCTWIAQVHPSLVGARNKAGETPFFLAAFHGRKDVFLRLLGICGPDNGLLYSRRENGETILHVAIAGDYFDLAFLIIHLYPDLVNYFDHEGFSPLHRLAGNPSNFRSGSYFGLYDKIIYHCLLVDELQVDPKVLKGVDPKVPVEHQEDPKVKKKSSLRFLENVHGGCVSVFQSFWKYMLQQVMGKKGDHTAELDLERDPGSEATNIGAPRNYVTCFEFLKLPLKAVWVVLGPGYAQLRRIHDKKQKHIWSVQIMNELLAERAASTTKYINTGTAPPTLPTDAYDSIFNDISSEISQKSNSPTPASLEANRSDKSEGKDASREGKVVQKGETPIFIAAKNGITEIVEKILELFPVAIHDVNSENKNIVLLAVEHRQPHVYQLLLGKENIQRDRVFGVVDNEGNSALHLAAKLGDYKPYLIPVAALQMQWEIKWYEFVKESMKTPHFFPRYNVERKTPKDLFTETHRDLIEKGNDWIIKTSESCSIVAALIATVAFTTSSTVPGGVKADTGAPTLEKHPPFQIFAISSLIALCFSIIAVVMFLAIITSRYQERDFGRYLPAKLLVGLTLLFVSIASMVISFCAGHSFMLKDELKYAEFPVYVVTCLLVTFFAMVQFPLYFELIRATFKKIPQRSYKAVSL